MDTDKLDMDKAHIQLVHVEPYFTAEELMERRTPFERQNKLSSFLYETPFTKDGKSRGGTVSQFMRKTVVTSVCVYVYVCVCVCVCVCVFVGACVCVC